MATYNKAQCLAPVLESIRRQSPPFDYEVIVTDDGSSDDTKEVCEFYGAKRLWLDRPYPAGPAKAKNMAYREAVGEILLCQNDDIRHETEDAIERLCDVAPRTFNVAITGGLNERGEVIEIPSIVERFPLLFFTAVPRKQMYAVGGEDEDFEYLNYEDTWTVCRLKHGRGMRAVWREDVVGMHLWHPRPPEHWEGERFQEMRDLCHRKIRRAEDTACWESPTGPWPYKET